MWNCITISKRYVKFNQYTMLEKNTMYKLQILQNPKIAKHHADLQSWLKKIVGCANSPPEKSSTTKKCEHIPCGYSMSTLWALNNMQNIVKTV